MINTKYITPIMNRTSADVEYAKVHQNDLEHKNIGAWNYTDANRVCNNLKYAAEYMYEQGFLSQPYSMQIKLDWKETDIITYETLNSMIVNNMNNLKAYSRADLTWFPIASIANMDYNIANWLERNIDALSTQVPLPPDTYRLTVKNGSGTGDYTAETVVTIQADPPEQGQAFSHWSGDHLENIGNASAVITTYKMPNQDINLKANYTGTVPHKLTVTTYTKTETANLSMGEIYYIEADPAPSGKVFHHWEVTPSQYEDGLYEPAATTHFTMPNAEVTLTAIYITKGEKELVVKNGNGSGWYEYDTYAAVSSNKPLNAVFTNWTGDTQYLTSDVTQEYNSVKIPDVNRIEISAHWRIPPVTNLKITLVNSTISSTGETEGVYDQGNRISIIANDPPEGQIFYYWEIEGDGEVSNKIASSTVFTVGTQDTTITAVYRDLEYHNLTVITNSGTTIKILEKYDYFTVKAEPYPENYTFDKWTGDIKTYPHPYEDWIASISHKFKADEPTTGTYMGDSDRTITANYRPINTHTLTVKQLSGDATYQQAEFSTIQITAEDAPEGQRFTGWKKSGEGQISSTTSKTIVFTFGNGDTILTPQYVNVWTITVIDGTINGSETALLDEGSDYLLETRKLAIWEGFKGWTQEGPGTIRNTAATSTRFTVGNGNATITANIEKYPDKTLTVSWRNPDTNVDTLVFQKTYTYGTRIENIVAHTAPNKTTFSSWLGDVDLLRPSALASTIYIDALTADTNIIATYYYPKSPEYYTLTVYDGYPESGSYAVGSQITIRAKTPAQGWEFHNWYGDVQYLVNPDVTLSENAVIMPQKAITLYVKFNVIGELPTYRVTVTEGTASGTYYTGEGEDQQRHDEGPAGYIDVPAGTEVTLTANPDTVGHTFSYWDGNFEEVGVTDIVKTNNPTIFTMVENNVNVVMIRKELAKASVYGTNATSLSEVYPGKYTISGTLKDTENYHYVFKYWTCVDADKNDCIDAIEDPSKEETTITVTEDKDLWIEAVYDTYYKLTVVEGQDTGSGYYKEGETINTVYANTPTPESRLQFDHWEDPVGIIQNIYDKTPTIIMKNSIATITAVFTSIDAKGNSIAMTSEDIHDAEITRHDSYLINGVYAVGTIVFDKDGCIGVITEIDPDQTDDTDDYKVEKLFYGGNF